MNTHDINLDRKTFSEIKSGTRPFDAELNHPKYEVGDLIFYYEVDSFGTRTGNAICAKAKSIVPFSEFIERLGNLVMSGERKAAEIIIIGLELILVED